MSRFAIAKDQVRMSLDAIVPELFGGGRKQTHRYPSRWAVTNKWRAGATIDQMSVWRDAHRRGAWKDYVSGDKGDAVDLVAYGLTGIVTDETRMQALAWIEDRFGIARMSAPERENLARAAEARQAELAVVDQRRQDADRDKARKFFFACSPQIIGTPVEVYLRGRGIELSDVPHMSAALRYREACGYWMGAQRDGEGNKIGADPAFPAMIAAMVTGDGHGPHACHYTFLEPGGSSKLRTGARGFLDDRQRPKSAKLMYPASSGLSIPLTYGPSGLKIADAAAAGKLGWMCFTEGIEDGLSVAIANAELRVHAAGSLAHLGSLADCPAAKGYLIFQDNDWGKPQAKAAFDVAVSRLRSFGKPVETLAMPKDWGKDVNDALNHEEGPET